MRGCGICGKLFTNVVGGPSDCIKSAQTPGVMTRTPIGMSGILIEVELDFHKHHIVSPAGKWPVLLHPETLL